MKGAREYAKLFETGQYGKLYIVVGRHARGAFFHIQVLPENEKAISNGQSNLCINDNAVEVYGILGGNPGWTEYYGWLHKGKWEQDFQELVKERISEIAKEAKIKAEEEAKERAIYKTREEKLLANY